NAKHPWLRARPERAGDPPLERQPARWRIGCLGAELRQQESHMALHPLAGKPAPKELLIDVGRLERAYYDRKPDLGDPNQRVAFGTSGHRGSSLHGTFTEAHILAITQAICEYRKGQRTDGPLYL